MVAVVYQVTIRVMNEFYFTKSSLDLAFKDKTDAIIRFYLYDSDDILISCDRRWIDDRLFHLKGDAKVRRPNDLLSSSSSSKRTSKRKPSSVGDNDDDSNNYDEDDDRGTMKLQTKRQCKTIESIKSQNSKVLQSNNNSINNSNSFNNNNSFNSSNFNIEERPIVETEISSREPSSTKKWVNVAVGEKSIGVPFIERWFVADYRYY